MRASRLLIAMGLVALAGAGAAAAQWFAMQAVEDRLSRAGLQFATRTVGVGQARWEGSTGPGVAVGALTLALLPTPRILLEDVVVDLDAVGVPDRASVPAASGVDGGLAVPVDLEGLTLRIAGDALLPPLSGSVLPVLALSGPQTSLSRGPDGGVRASVSRSLSFGPVSGEAALDVTCVGLGSCAVKVDIPEAVFEDPLLAPGPLDPVAMRGEGTISLGDRTATGVLRVGSVPVSLAIDADRRLRVSAEAVPLADLLVPFAPYVPDARHAQVEGIVGGVAVVDLETRRLLELHPTAEGLASRGMLADPGALARGSVTWRAPLEGGDWVVRTTGAGWPGWTPLSQAGLVPAAMVAAEDAAFWRHGGVHLPAVTDAITESLADPSAPLRGGSTITQQLAKNLFCDPGDRTLARKLAELLYALELEGVLSKRRILELYINIVELGPQLYGVGPAADAYFIKRPDRMTPSEAAFLASILPAPRTFYQRALGGRPPRARMAFVLDNMANGGVLTAREAEVAKARPPRIVPLGTP